MFDKRYPTAFSQATNSRLLELLTLKHISQETQAILWDELDRRTAPDTEETKEKGNQQ